MMRRRPRGDPNRDNPLPGGEFENERGETQYAGSRGITAVPPNLPPTAIGIAPPDPMVVVSNFDTRPIGAYDFSVVGFVTMGNAEEQLPATITFVVPNGYTLVLRRVRIEVNPPAVMSFVSADVQDRRMEMSLLRDGAVIPNNSEVVRGALSDFEWPTHQVFGMNSGYGVRFFAPNGFAIPDDNEDTCTVQATLQGTLIPSKSRPPEVEIASDPVLVRIFNDPKLINDGGGA